jgi:hypothetical protein
MEKVGTCRKLWKDEKLLGVNGNRGPDSAIGSDWLRAGRSRDRIPVGARFSAPVQTGPGAHPAFCTMGTGSFPGGRMRPSRDADPHPLLVPKSKNRVELYFFSP